MDIAWDMETAAADTRGEQAQQAREDAAAVDETWLDIVRLFPRDFTPAAPSQEVAGRESHVRMPSGECIAVPCLVITSVITPRPSFFRRLFTLGV